MAAAGVAAILFGVVGFGEMFAVITYLAPISTTVTGIPAAAMPLVQFALGVAMTLGTLIAGWLADRSVDRVLLGFVIGMVLSLAGFTVRAHRRRAAPVHVIDRVLQFWFCDRHPGPHDRPRSALAGFGRRSQPIRVGPGQLTRRLPWRIRNCHRIRLPGAGHVGLALSTLGAVIVVIALAVGRAERLGRWQPVQTPAAYK